MDSPSAKEALELATVLDTLADGVFVVDTQHAVSRWNRAMESLTGYAAQEVIGQKCSLFFADCGAAAGSKDALYCELFASGKLENTDMLVVRKNGETLPVLARARVMYGSEGNPLGAVVTVTDLSVLRRLESEVEHLRHELEEKFEFHGIVGKSPEMREVVRLAEMAAASEATILIDGETGTGKEMIAKAIHYHGSRKNGPLVSVNCSALSETLIESELFGHVRGAFTGATQDYAGRFERAHGGTLFLDEVGEIPPLVQVKLLRVLQEREIERVGESKPRKVDVRIVAATHRDLRERVRQGQFREDLFYRLKIFPIHLPPLRERKEDIDPLVGYFVAKFNRQTGKSITGFAPDAYRILMDYCWPGNIRELENAVEHAFVTCPGGQIGPLDLPIELRRIDLKQQVCGQAPSTVVSTQTVTHGHRKPVSRDEMLALLNECGWNKAEVGRRLGITRTHVWRRMKQLGIPLEGGG